MERHSLVQFVFKSACFSRKKFAILKIIYFHFQSPKKQMMVFFRTRLGEILIWQKLSEA